MGVVQAPRIVAQLLAHLPAELPAAVVQHASHATRQRHAIATLGTLVQTLHSQGFGSPAVLVIGRVLEAAGVEGLSELSRLATA
jgi:uroporphyrin-III C-methyltransferase